MPRSAAALLAVAALVSVCQWCWMRLAVHVDPLRIPVQSRRRVAWLTAHSARVQTVAVGVGLTAVAMTLLQ